MEKRRCIAAALYVATLLSAMSLLTGTAAADVVRAAKYLPRDSAMVGAWNVARSRGSTIGDPMARVLSTTSPLGRFIGDIVANADLKWHAHLDIITLAMPANVAKSGRAVVLIEGTFESEQIVAALQKRGRVRTRTYRGIQLYEQKGFEMTFVDRYWVIGQKDGATRVIDVSLGRSGSLARNKKVLELLKAADLGKDVWCAWALPKALREVLAEATDAQFANVGAITASIDLADKGLRTRVRLALSDRDAVVEMGALLRDKAGRDPRMTAIGLGAAMGALRLSRYQNNLDIKVEVPDQDIGKVRDYMVKLADSASRQRTDARAGAETDKDAAKAASGTRDRRGKDKRRGKSRKRPAE